MSERDQTSAIELAADDKAQTVMVNPALTAAAFTKVIFQFFRLGELHESSNAIFTSANQDVLRLIETIMRQSGQKGVQLSFRGEIIFLNGKSIRPKARQFHIYKYLIKFFKVRKIGGIKILTLPNPADLQKFLWGLVRMADSDNPVTMLKEYFISERLTNFEIEARKQAGEDANSDSDLASDIELLVAALYQRLLKFAEVLLANRANAAAFDLARPEGALQELALMADEDIIQMLRLVSVKVYERPLPYQAVHASMLAMAWGRSLSLPLNVVVELAGAALAHPIAVLAAKENRTSKLPAEAAVLKVLDEFKDVWPLTELQRLTVLEWTKPHGDDGVYKTTSGTACYPHFFSRIVRICALFEALTTQSSDHQARLPDEALSELLKKNGLCDPTLVKLFVNWVGVYPVGSLVELQSGEVAQVFAAASDPTRFQRPLVSVLKDTGGEILKRPYLVDLAELNPRLGVFKKSIKRSLSVAEAKIPFECFQIDPVSV